MTQRLNKSYLNMLWCKLLLAQCYIAWENVGAFMDVPWSIRICDNPFYSHLFSVLSSNHIEICSCCIKLVVFDANFNDHCKRTFVSRMKNRELHNMEFYIQPLCSGIVEIRIFTLKIASTGSSDSALDFR